MRHGQTVKTYKRSMESGLRAQGLQTSLRHFFQWNAAEDAGSTSDARGHQPAIAAGFSMDCANGRAGIFFFS